MGCIHTKDTAVVPIDVTGLPDRALVAMYNTPDDELRKRIRFEICRRAYVAGEFD
jgi:hypothetical protein